jgi:FtsZ-binding cell division protein ZapB
MEDGVDRYTPIYKKLEEIVSTMTSTPNKGEEWTLHIIQKLQKMWLFHDGVFVKVTTEEFDIIQSYLGDICDFIVCQNNEVLVQVKQTLIQPPPDPEEARRVGIKGWFSCNSVDEHDHRMEDLEDRMDFAQERLKSLLSRIDRIENARDAVMAENEQLRQENKDLKEKIQTLEQCCTCRVLFAKQESNEEKITDAIQSPRCLFICEEK